LQHILSCFGKSKNIPSTPSLIFMANWVLRPEGEFYNLVELMHV
jgi:hypothetical protein